MTGKEESTTHTHVSGGGGPPPHPPPSSGATSAGPASALGVSSGGKATHAPLPLKQQAQQQPPPQTPQLPKQTKGILTNKV